MKKIKRALSLLLTLSLIMGLSTTAFATEPSAQSVQILANSDSVCVVREVTADGVTIATNNKETGILTIEKYDDSESFLLSTDTLDLNAIARSVEEESQSPATLDDHIYQHTFSNREYDIYFHTDFNHWVIRSGDNSKVVYESSSNISPLENFRNAVEDVNAAEFSLIASVGSTVALTAIAAFLTGGVAAGVAAAGGSASAVAAFASLNSAINSADYYYARAN